MLGFARLAALGKYVPFRYLPGLFGAVAVALAVAVGALEGLEYWSLEKFFEVRGAVQPRAPIVIVAIDESSFIELNQQWPFPREMHAQLLRKIAADRPLAIGVDLIFDVPSSRGDADDVALGEAVAAAGNVVLGSAPKFENRGFVEGHDANMPLPVIRKGAVVGPVNLVQDVVDGHVRRAPLRVRVGDDLDPGFDAQIYHVAVKHGLPAAPLPQMPEIIINFNGPPRTFP